MAVNKRKLRNRRRKKKEAIKYIKGCIKQDHLPDYKELKKKFGIGHLKITTKELYLEAGIEFLEIVNIKRPNNCIFTIREELINYLKKEVSKNHYPSRREIENKFHLRLATKLFDGIEDLYKKADLIYKQENNQQLKIKKAEMLNKIVLSILSKIGLKLIKVRNVHERGIDILTKDKKNNLVGIEIKAYNQYESVKKRNIEQIERWLIENNFDRILLITTTSRIENNIKIPKNLELMKFGDLIKICNKKYLDDLNFIRNYSIHIDTNQHKTKRELIKKYIINNYKDNERIEINDLAKILKLDIYTYFKNQLELYEYCNILPPLNLIRVRSNKNKNKLCSKYLKVWESKIIDYIKEEIAKDNYPLGIEINEEFNVHPVWRFFKVNELYRKAGYKPYRERRPRFKVVKILA